MTKNRALRRALQIERKTRKLYARRLRELMTPNAYEEFARVCQGEAIEMTADLAKVTTETRDA